MSGGTEEEIAAQLGAQPAPLLHIPDDVRVAVLAGDEEAELWLQGHLMGCAECREPLTQLFEKAVDEVPVSEGGGVDCAQARNAVFNHLEGGHEVATAALQHILTCDACADMLYEPAKAATVLEFNPDETGEAG